MRTGSNRKLTPDGGGIKQEPVEVRFTMRQVTNRQDDTSIPQRGEPILALDTNEFLVGDGHTPMCALPGIDNVVTAADGRLYTVTIDAHGQVVDTICISQPMQYQGVDLTMHLCASPIHPLSTN